VRACARVDGAGSGERLVNRSCGVAVLLAESKGLRQVCAPTRCGAGTATCKVLLTRARTARWTAGTAERDRGAREGWVGGRRRIRMLRSRDQWCEEERLRPVRVVRGRPAARFALKSKLAMQSR